MIASSRWACAIVTLSNLGAGALLRKPPKVQEPLPGLLVMWPLLTVGRSSSSVIFGIEYPKDVVEASFLRAGQTSMAGLQLGLTPEQHLALTTLANAAPQPDVRQKSEAEERITLFPTYRGGAPER
jgi:hypothetical protein